MAPHSRQTSSTAWPKARSRIVWAAVFSPAMFQAVVFSVVSVMTDLFLSSSSPVSTVDAGRTWHLTGSSGFRLTNELAAGASAGRIPLPLLMSDTTVSGRSSPWS